MKRPVFNYYTRHQNVIMLLWEGILLPITLQERNC